MKFFRPTYNDFSSEKKAKVHATKDGVTTLCGIRINTLWQEVFEFKWGICEKCKKIFPTITKHGKQLVL